MGFDDGVGKMLLIPLGDVLPWSRVEVSKQRPGNDSDLLNQHHQPLPY